MGISPIANLAALSLARPVEAALEPLPMARVENSARNGDDAYSPSGGKPNRGSEDHESEDEANDLAIDAGDQTASQDTQPNQASQISFFA